MAKDFRLDSDARTLLPARVLGALTLAAKLSPSVPQATMRGQELRLARALSLDDGACASFVLDFAGQGTRIVGTAHGPSAALLAWALHTIAASTKCALAEDGDSVSPSPEAHRDAALAYLDAYEADVVASRKRGELDGDAFVAWLTREELVETEPGGDFADLPMDDPERLYELLLEDEHVADVFLSERELARALERFRARAQSR